MWIIVAALPSDATGDRWPVCYRIGFRLTVAALKEENSSYIVRLWDLSEWTGEQTITAVEQAMPHTLTKVSGDEQEGMVGAALAKPFVVSVLDQNGSAFAGAVVTFSVTAGGGALSATTATTDNGRARDSAGAAATLTFSITVNPALSFGDLFGAAGKANPAAFALADMSSSLFPQSQRSTPASFRPTLVNSAVFSSRCSRSSA